MSRLFEPLRVGRCNLKHRIVMAPMTRLRADDEHIPQEMVLDYYEQRASVPGTLLITESIFISAKSRGRDPNAPGIYTPEQITQWSRICAAVHGKGSYIFAQLWHLGRAARKDALERAGLELISSSDVPISEEHDKPRPMTEAEIWDVVQQFAEAAKNAVAAGFDGVEIHGANGYLIDQFTQDVCNRRTDDWGGTIEKRSRFCVEVTRAVCAAIGSDRVGIRLSPFNEFQGMHMSEPIPQFSHLILQLKSCDLAYLHLVESRVSGNVDRAESTESLNFAHNIWDKSRPMIVAGGYTPEAAIEVSDSELKDSNVAIAFGRHFISNPDLPFRVARGIPLEQYDRATFYKVKSRDGYTDYAFSTDWDEYRPAQPLAVTR